MTRAPRRGDVYWVALDPTIGTEIKKSRPAVVVSNDSCNTHGRRVVVLPITSNVDSLYPGEALTRIKGQPGRAIGDQTPLSGQNPLAVQNRIPDSAGDGRRR